MLRIFIVLLLVLSFVASAEAQDSELCHFTTSQAKSIERSLEAMGKLDPLSEAAWENLIAWYSIKVPTCFKDLHGQLLHLEFSRLMLSAILDDRPDMAENPLFIAIIIEQDRQAAGWIVALCKQTDFCADAP